MYDASDQYGVLSAGYGDMSRLGDYVFSVIAVALINSLVSGMLQDPAMKGIVKIVCGMVLTIAVVAPVLHADFDAWEWFGDGILESADAVVEEGEALAYNALYDRIKQETEAYIQDKAAQLNAEIAVTVILNKGDPPIPIGAEIEGKVIPYTKQRLEKILETQLGIAKENIEWTG